MPMEIERSYRYACDSPGCTEERRFAFSAEAEEAGWLLVEVNINLDARKFTMIACSQQCLVNGFADELFYGESRKP